MSDPLGRLASGDLASLDPGRLEEWIAARRWFAGKAREISQLEVLDAVPLGAGSPSLILALIGVRFGDGTHDLYQLPLSAESRTRAPASRIARLDGLAVYDALAEPREAERILRLLAAGATAEGREGEVRFHWVGGEPPPSASLPARPVAAEQSNSSVVFGESLILKAYRRIEAGISPELELLRFLTGRGFANVAPLRGWYEYSGRPVEATLGVLQAFVANARDGWELALDALTTDPHALLPGLAELGRVSGEMHALLGSAPADPVFAPEEPSAESVALLVARIDEEVDRVFVDLPADERLDPIAHRGEEVREQLQLLASIGTSGRVIRVHGDLHLGQALHREDGWTLLDFEGEPVRPLTERRRKHSPLRDVAGMLRSFAYAASAAEIQRGATVPEGWEEGARASFLDGYLEAVDPSLLPPTRDGIDRLLALYELEKAVYELRYELENRPDWVRIPVAGILRLLEVPAT